MHCHPEEGASVGVMASKSILLSTKLVLASGSPRRMQIMKSAGFEFEIQDPDVDEDGIGEGLPAEKLAVELARAKARAVANDMPDATVIAADTVVSKDGVLYAKPQEADDAVQMLRELGNSSHTVTTGVSVVRFGQRWAHYESTIVNMRDYDADEIAAYVESGSPLDKAGAYGIQDTSFMPAVSIEGCYLNVVGLPMCLASNLMARALLFDDRARPDCPNHNMLPGLAI